MPYHLNGIDTWKLALSDARESAGQHRCNPHYYLCGNGDVYMVSELGHLFYHDHRKDTVVQVWCPHDGHEIQDWQPITMEPALGFAERPEGDGRYADHCTEIKPVTFTDVLIRTGDRSCIYVRFGKILYEGKYDGRGLAAAAKPFEDWTKHPASMSVIESPAWKKDGQGKYTGERPAGDGSSTERPEGDGRSTESSVEKWIQYKKTYRSPPYSYLPQCYSDEQTFRYDLGMDNNNNYLDRIVHRAKHLQRMLLPEDGYCTNGSTLPTQTSNIGVEWNASRVWGLQESAVGMKNDTCVRNTGFSLAKENLPEGAWLVDFGGGFVMIPYTFRFPDRQDCTWLGEVENESERVGWNADGSMDWDAISAYPIQADLYCGLGETPNLQTIRTGLQIGDCFRKTGSDSIYWRLEFNGWKEYSNYQDVRYDTQSDRYTLITAGMRSKGSAHKERRWAKGEQETYGRSCQPEYLLHGISGKYCGGLFLATDNHPDETKKHWYLFNTEDPKHMDDGYGEAWLACAGKFSVVKIKRTSDFEYRIYYRKSEKVLPHRIGTFATPIDIPVNDTRHPQEMNMENLVFIYGQNNGDEVTVSWNIRVYCESGLVNEWSYPGAPDSYVYGNNNHQPRAFLEGYAGGSFLIPTNEAGGQENSGSWKMIEGCSVFPSCPHDFTHVLNEETDTLTANGFGKLQLARYVPMSEDGSLGGSVTIYGDIDCAAQGEYQGFLNYGESNQSAVYIRLFRWYYRGTPRGFVWKSVYVDRYTGKYYNNDLGPGTTYSHKDDAFESGEYLYAYTWSFIERRLDETGMGAANNHTGGQEVFLAFVFHEFTAGQMLTHIAAGGNPDYPMINGGDFGNLSVNNPSQGLFAERQGGGLGCNKLIYSQKYIKDSSGNYVIDNTNGEYMIETDQCDGNDSLGCREQLGQGSVSYIDENGGDQILCVNYPVVKCSACSAAHSDVQFSWEGTTFHAPVTADDPSGLAYYCPQKGISNGLQYAWFFHKTGFSDASDANDLLTFMVSPLNVKTQFGVDSPYDASPNAVWTVFKDANDNGGASGSHVDIREGTSLPAVAAAAAKPYQPMTSSSDAALGGTIVYEEFITEPYDIYHTPADGEICESSVHTSGAWMSVWNNEEVYIPKNGMMRHVSGARGGSHALGYANSTEWKIYEQHYSGSGEIGYYPDTSYNLGTPSGNSAGCPSFGGAINCRLGSFTASANGSMLQSIYGWRVSGGSFQTADGSSDGNPLPSLDEWNTRQSASLECFEDMMVLTVTWEDRVGIWISLRGKVNRTYEYDPLEDTCETHVEGHCGYNHYSVRITDLASGIVYAGDDKHFRGVIEMSSYAWNQCCGDLHALIAEGGEWKRNIDDDAGTLKLDDGTTCTYNPVTEMWASQSERSETAEGGGRITFSQADVDGGETIIPVQWIKGDDYHVYAMTRDHIGGEWKDVTEDSSLDDIACWAFQSGTWNGDHTEARDAAFLTFGRLGAGSERQIAYSYDPNTLITEYTNVALDCRDSHKVFSDNRFHEQKQINDIVAEAFTQDAHERSHRRTGAYINVDDSIQSSNPDYDTNGILKSNVSLDFEDISAPDARKRLYVDDKEAWVRYDRMPNVNDTDIEPVGFHFNAPDAESHTTTVWSGNGQLYISHPQ